MEGPTDLFIYKLPAMDVGVSSPVEVLTEH